MLHLPRLELLLFMMVLPMIVAAGATLLRVPGAGYVAAGVFFAVLLPVAFVGVSLAFIMRYLVRHSVDQRRAVFVLALPPTMGAPVGAAALGQSPFQQQSQQQQQQQEQLPEPTPRGSSTLPPTQQQQFLRPSSSGLTQQFLGPADSGLSNFASATSTAQFILQRQPSGALGAADAGGAPPPEVGTAPGSPASPGSSSSGSASGGGLRGACRRGWQGFQRYFMRPVFGFDLSGGTPQQQQQNSAATIPVGTVADGGSLTGQGAWLCKSKWDTAFVKRYGSLFEDARGPQVYHITSVYETAATDGESVGAGSGAVFAANEACAAWHV
jgi:hypothetical protein